MFTSCQELEARIAEYTRELDGKFDGSEGMRYVMLCGGTGCVAANSMGIKERFEALIEKNGDRKSTRLNSSH